LNVRRQKQAALISNPNSSEDDDEDIEDIDEIASEEVAEDVHQEELGLAESPTLANLPQADSSAEQKIKDSMIKQDLSLLICRVTSKSASLQANKSVDQNTSANQL
jgi:hypothetical protein